MMVEVVNRQRQRKMDCERWRVFAAKAMTVVPARAADVTIAFVSDRAMSELNRRWRGKRGPTDVLSFAAGVNAFAEPPGLLGDIVISVERAAAQARENGLRFENEIAQLILHGLLHLCGYDHATDKGEMNRVELRLRRRLSI